MATVFVTYRRDDSSGHVGRLVDHLRRAVWPHRVIVDIEEFSKSPGSWSEKIDNALRECKVFIVVIGTDWLDKRNSKGERRLDDPKDVHRCEIKKALGRMNIEVVPVLVNNAGNPAVEQLPDDIAAITDQEAFEISDRRWKSDVARFGRMIRRLLPWWPTRFTAWAAGLLIAAAIIVAVIIYSPPRSEPAIFTVDAEPPSATIQMIDSDGSDVEYRAGITLAPGPYTIIVAQDGYVMETLQIELGDTDLVVPVELVAVPPDIPQPSTHSLTINTTPPDATIRLPDIQPPYVPGMRLEPDRYRIEVSKQNYQTKIVWIDLEADLILPVELDDVPVSSCFPPIEMVEVSSQNNFSRIAKLLRAKGCEIERIPPGVSLSRLLRGINYMYSPQRDSAHSLQNYLLQNGIDLPVIPAEPGGHASPNKLVLKE